MPSKVVVYVTAEPTHLGHIEEAIKTWKTWSFTILEVARAIEEDTREVIRVTVEARDDTRPTGVQVAFKKIGCATKVRVYPELSVEASDQLTLYGNLWRLTRECELELTQVRRWIDDQGYMPTQAEIVGMISLVSEAAACVDLIKSAIQTHEKNVQALANPPKSAEQQTPKASPRRRKSKTQMEE